MLRAASRLWSHSVSIFRRALMHTQVQGYEEYFNYNFGRWIHDESRQLSLRYRKFNVEGLQTVACKAGGARSVIEMKKLAEGSYNKAFLLSLHNGVNLVARVPTYLAGPAHLVTASEVATMDFAHRRLGIPTPRILDWCSDSSKTDVEAEYIIMEHVTYSDLSTTWNDLSASCKEEVVQRIVEIEEKILNTRISGGYGSLYHRGDIDAAISVDIFVDGDLDHDFVLGPLADRSFWHEERQNMALDRGPWTDPLSYLTSFAKRESQWILNHAKVDSNPGPFDPPVHVQVPDTHISVLNSYITLAPHLLPQDSSFTRSTLWHTELHVRNIFVSSGDSFGSMQICSIIDWQHLHLAPLLLQARVPSFIRYENPTSVPTSSPGTLLTANSATDTAVEDEHITNNELGGLHAKYVSIHRSHHTDCGKVLKLPKRDLIFHSFKFSGYTWTGRLVPLRDCLIRIAENWSTFQEKDGPCPIQFSDFDKQKHRIEAKEWQDAVDGRRDLNQCLGVGEDGWAPLEKYHEAVEANKLLRSQFLEDLDDPEEGAQFV